MGDDTISNRGGRGTLNRRNFIKVAGAGGAALSADYLGSLPGEREQPSRPVEVISPWSTGGRTDRTSHAVTGATENHTDVSWDVSSQAGGPSPVGMNTTANARPNRHTIGCTAPETALLEHLGIADLSPDDAIPIMQCTGLPVALVVSEDTGFSTFDEWISYGQDNTLQVVNSGFGSSWHMATAGIASEADANVEHVSREGAAPAMTAVVSSEVDCTAVGTAEVAPQVQDDGLSALGAAFDQQVEALPNTPTLQDQGLDISIDSWLAHFAPAGIDDGLKQQLANVYSAIYEDDSFVEFMENNNFIRVERGPDELQGFLDQRYEFYGNLVDEPGIEEQ